MKSIKDGDFVMEEMDMREEYDIKALNPRKNPYAKKIKKPVTMNMSVTTIEYFTKTDYITLSINIHLSLK